MTEAARRRIAIALVALATLTGMVTLLATWAKRQALDTQEWVETSGKLLVDERIQDALAAYLTEQIYDAANPQERLAAVLPPRLAPVAGPVSGLVRNGIERAVERILASPKIQDLWHAANRTANEALVAIVEDKPIRSPIAGTAVDSAAANLDLSEIRKQVTDALGLDPVLPPGTRAGVAQAIEDGGDETSVIEVIAPDELDAVQKGGKLIKGLSLVSLFVTLALYAGAIYLTPGSRRRTLTMSGLSLLFVGIAAMTFRRIGGEEVANTLAATDSVRPATLAAWEIGTSLLKDMAMATIFYGIAVIGAALLAGPSKVATKLRGWLAPAIEDPMGAVGGTAIALLLLIWWSPTPAFSTLLGVVVLGALLAAGVYALRRQIISEAAAVRN